MTSEELQAIRERANRATPGPWRKRAYKNADGDIWIDCNAFANKGNGRCLGGTLAVALHSGTGKSTVENNADFIAHVRQDVPDLLDEVITWKAQSDYNKIKLVKANAQIERLRAALERIAYREENTGLKWMDIVDELVEIARQALEGKANDSASHR